ncbi:MAG: metal-dependent phosphohydrolase, partial [Chitinophagaceae bacterium]
MTNSEKLINWVAEQHGDQLIKKTRLPYLNHLTAVGNLSESFVRLGFEIGLCHDLLEDTSASDESLFNALQNFGYSLDDTNRIVDCVKELTDVFSKNQFPELSKKERKKRESERLVSISPTSQTVKYA